MQKEILVFIFDGYADWEGAYICAELNKRKTEFIVRTLSLDKEPKTSMGGFCVIPDYTIMDYPDDYSMLILLGGEAWIEGKNNKVITLVKHAINNNIPIGAICNAVTFLAEHGYLDNIKHTGNTLEYIKEKAPHYNGDENLIEQQAIFDSNLITANGTAALEFAREIMKCLKILSLEEINEWYNINKIGYYS